MRLVIRKPVYAICEQQRRRSACASAQSDQRLCCSLPRYYNTSSFYIQNFKPLSSFCGCAGRLVSYLVANPEDRFSHDEDVFANDLLFFLFAAQSDHELSGNEDPNILHAYIAYLPSRIAYREGQYICSPEWSWVIRQWRPEHSPCLHCLSS